MGARLRRDGCGEVESILEAGRAGREIVLGSCRGEGFGKEA